MSDELKPVRCGCGGEAKTVEKFYSGATNYISQEYCIECVNCGCRSAYKYTEAKAVQAWNRAMGATDTNVGDKERKKGTWLHKPNEYDDDTYECSQCGEPWTLIEGTPEENNMKFCPNCGARLEWNE